MKTRNSLFLSLLLTLLSYRSHAEGPDSLKLAIHDLSAGTFVFIERFDDQVLLGDNRGWLYAWSFSSNRITNMKHLENQELVGIYYDGIRGHFWLHCGDLYTDEQNILLLDKSLTVLDTLAVPHPVASFAGFNANILAGNIEGQVFEMTDSAGKISVVNTIDLSGSASVQKIIPAGCDSVFVFLFSGEIRLFRVKGRNWTLVKTIPKEVNDNFFYDAHYLDGLFILRRAKGNELRNKEMELLYSGFPQHSMVRFYSANRIVSFSSLGKAIVYHYTNQGIFSIQEEFFSVQEPVKVLYPDDTVAVPTSLLSGHLLSLSDSVHTRLWDRKNVTAFDVAGGITGLAYTNGEFEVLSEQGRKSELFDIEKDRVAKSMALPFEGPENMIFLKTFDNILYGYIYPSGENYLAHYAAYEAGVYDKKANTLALFTKEHVAFEYVTSYFDQTDFRTAVAHDLKADFVSAVWNRSQRTLVVLTADSALHLFDYEKKELIRRIPLSFAVDEVITFDIGYMILGTDGQLFSLFGTVLSLIDKDVDDFCLTLDPKQTAVYKDDRLVFLRGQKGKVILGAGYPLTGIVGQNLVLASFDKKAGKLYYVVQSQQGNAYARYYNNDFLMDAELIEDGLIFYVDALGNLISLDVRR